MKRFSLGSYRTVDSHDRRGSDQVRGAHSTPIATLALQYGRALQHLSLENYSVDWTALLPLGVTHHLSGLRSVHLARLWPPLPSDFLDILLSTAPRLESPHLLDTLPDDLYFPSRCRWHTSSLRSCHLEGPLNLVSKIFLQIMSMLIRSDLRITFRSSYSGSPLSFPPDPATWSYYGESLQAVTCFINDSGLLEDKIVEVYKQEWREHSLSETELPPSFCHPTPAPSRRSTFLETIHLPRLRHLVLHSTSSIHLPEQTWRRFFELHPHVETLALKARYMLDPIITVIRLLALRDSSSRDRTECGHVDKESNLTQQDTVSSPLLPKLQKLVPQGLYSQRRELNNIFAELKALLHWRSSCARSDCHGEKVLDDSGFLAELVGVRHMRAMWMSLGETFLTIWWSL
ncbi:hypothetical protein BDV98DRAFT_598245 [Pterulicium gracile]|uniref:Uncharacterized protein n=1 Tax=Pterulicium gracile TaxID=1884261 RepID=A0A5C3Q1V3_9AGAR|nr:hypothetical protein BDV98DRAFT_598245 [Pterula gracilis]